MLKTRVIPCLQLLNDGLVKATRFKNPKYIGDPVNTVRMFNELEVDELCFLNIRATLTGESPDFGLLRQISDECFMPLSYGGGIRDVDTAARILETGFEKVIVNTAFHESPHLIGEFAKRFGSQAVVVSIDVRRNLFGRPIVYSHCGSKKTHFEPVKWAQQAASEGAGEILLTAMDREGTWAGFDTQLIEAVASSVKIPVIAQGGGGTLEHLSEAVKTGKASAVAIGSMVVYQKKGMGVLVSFPDKEKLRTLF